MFIRWFLAILLLVGSTLTVTFVAMSSSRSSLSSTAITTFGVQPNDITYGDPQANVVFIEYGDFECEKCASYVDIMKRLRRHYGGRVLFVFRFLPMPQHRNSLLAAKAAYAAGAQGQFFAMHDLLYSNLSTWRKSQAVWSDFLGYARFLHLDLREFRSTVMSPEAERFIINQAIAAVRAGVEYAPWFVVNGRAILWPRDYEGFSGPVEQALEQ